MTRARRSRPRTGRDGSPSPPPCLGRGQMGSTLMGSALKSPSVKKHEICSGPISADPMCPFPNAVDVGPVALQLRRLPAALQIPEPKDAVA